VIDARRLFAVGIVHGEGAGVERHSDGCSAARSRRDGTRFVQPWPLVRAQVGGFRSVDASLQPNKTAPGVNGRPFRVSDTPEASIRSTL
jgi:hypothetical protein